MNRVRKQKPKSMSDIRKSVTCDYCGEEFSIKYAEDLKPEFCCLCGERFANLTEELKDEEDNDGDMDEYEQAD